MILTYGKSLQPYNMALFANFVCVILSASTQFLGNEIKPRDTAMYTDTNQIELENSTGLR